MSPKYWYSGWEDDNGPSGAPSSGDAVLIMSGNISASDIGTASISSLSFVYASGSITFTRNGTINCTGNVNLNFSMSVTGTGTINYGSLTDPYGYLNAATYTVTLSVTNGTINSGTNPRTGVSAGAQPTWGVTPNSGYVLDYATSCSWTPNTCTADAVNGNLTIYVVFKLNGVTVTVPALSEATAAGIDTIVLSHILIVPDVSSVTAEGIVPSIFSAVAQITVNSYDKARISSVANKDVCTVKFQSDIAISQWEARAGGSGAGSGILVDSGGAVSASVEVTFTILDEELTGGDNAYRINIYGMNPSGWSAYG